MTLRDLIDRYRRDMLDTKAPFMWSDADLTYYANQAETEACRRALLLVDSTSSLTQIDITAGDVGVDLDPAILYIRRARLASRGKSLGFKVVRAMDEDVPGWEDATASVPLIGIPDWQSGYLRFWPPSAAADTLKTTVIRTPLQEMVSDSDEPEIPPRYHAHLIKWMKHLGYSKQDVDAYDPKKAQEQEAQFAAEFGPVRSALDEHWAEEQYFDVGAF